MSTMFAQPALPHTLTGPPSPPSPLQHHPQPTSPLTYSTTTTPPVQNQYTPPSSAETTTTPTATTTPLSPISPRTSWHIPQHSRQIRQRQGPLYVPAVLRPTEKPARSSPPKPGAGYYGSAESFEEFGGGAGVYGGERPLGAGVLSRIVTEEWNEDVLGPVTGTPSRNHWKPDTASPTCDDNACTTPFTFFTRRHHCRRCGRIFCFSHSTHLVPLDQHARFHPQAPKHRACNSCWSDYRTWEGARGSRSNSEGSSREGTVPGTPGVAWPINMVGVRGEGGMGGMKAPASVAKSVPRDWSWSTF